ncbi:MAG: hypothetical protein ABI574_06420 [Burkholderiales bacterium]
MPRPLLAHLLNRPLWATSLLLCAGMVQAQPAKENTSAGFPIEPRVQVIVIEDDGARIEELHVRGEAQRIKVQPKGLSPRLGYEILPASGGRDMSPSASSMRGVAGQRVWSVLSF